MVLSFRLIRVLDTSCIFPSAFFRARATDQVASYVMPLLPINVRLTEASVVFFRISMRLSFDFSSLPISATSASINLSLRRGVSLYKARQMASRIVVFPEPVLPVIRNTSLLARGSASKSIMASLIDAML